MPIHTISVTFTPAAFRMLLTHSCVYVAVNLDAVNAYVRMDNSPAFKLMGDNWGSDLVKNVRDSTYGAINVLLDYEKVPEIKSDLEVAATTKWNLQPKLLYGTKTISCVICHLTEEILATDPEILKAEVVKHAPLTDVGGHTLQFQVGRWAHGFMMQRRLNERRP